MPESKSRHPHKHPHHPAKPADIQPKSGSNNRIVTVSIIFFAVIGLGIGCFIDVSNLLVLAAGIVLGGIAGYFAGVQFKKSLSGRA